MDQHGASAWDRLHFAPPMPENLLIFSACFGDVHEEISRPGGSKIGANVRSKSGLSSGG